MHYYITRNSILTHIVVYLSYAFDITLENKIKFTVILPRSQRKNQHPLHPQHGPPHGNQMDGRSQLGHQQENLNQVRYFFSYLLFII